MHARAHTDVQTRAGETEEFSWEIPGLWIHIVVHLVGKSWTYISICTFSYPESKALPLYILNAGSDVVSMEVSVCVCVCVCVCLCVSEWVSGISRVAGGVSFVLVLICIPVSLVRVKRCCLWQGMHVHVHV